MEEYVGHELQALRIPKVLQEQGVSDADHGNACRDTGVHGRPGKKINHARSNTQQRSGQRQRYQDVRQDGEEAEIGDHPMEEPLAVGDG